MIHEWWMVENNKIQLSIILLFIYKFKRQEIRKQDKKYVRFHRIVSSFFYERKTKLHKLELTVVKWTLHLIQ